MEKKKYEYFYPENKALGAQLKGMAGFICKMLNKKYCKGYIKAVMQGKRKNDEIISAMKQLAELSNIKNY